MSKFKKLESKLAAKGAENPAALAAYIGRQKLGEAGMEKKAKAGEKRVAKQRKGK